MDETFDIFEQPQAPRERSGREQEHDAKISYRKYQSTQRVPCWPCCEYALDDLSIGVRTATIVRKEGQDETYLCGRHAQERRDREVLDRHRAEDAGRA